MIVNNKITFAVYIVNQFYFLYDTVDIQAFEKYNVVGTYNGSQMKLYVNGNLKNIINLEGQISDSQVPITIGANPQLNSVHVDKFIGSIYDVKVYKKVLSDQEINKYYTYTRQTFNTPGITPEYTYRTTNRILDMDSRKANGGTSVSSGSTSTWYDLAQSTNRSLTNFAYDRTSGWDYNGGLIFDGTDDYVICGKAKDFNETSAITISVTVKPEKVSGNAYIIANLESSGYGLYFRSDKCFRVALRLKNLENYAYILSSPVETNGDLYNVIFRFDGTKLSLYINGVEGTPLVLDAKDTIVDKTIDNIIGANPNSKSVPTGEYFKGVIYDAKIYDAALTDAEIQQLWEHQNHQYAIQK